MKRAWLKKVINFLRLVIGIIVATWSIINLIKGYNDTLINLLLLILGIILLLPILAAFRKNKWILTLIVLPLIIFNPSTTAFKDSEKELSDSSITIYKRKYNFILFSVYSKEWGVNDDKKKIYIGIIGNFFERE